jgi:hypothetical protein
MPRDVNGVYALPSPLNPVVGGSPISSNWANTTLTDLAAEITLSLDRTGRGAMTQPLQLPDGSASAPALTFSADTNTGIYRGAADDLRITTGGTLRVTVTSAGLTIAAALALGGQIQGADGTVGAPGISFQSDTNTGIYRAGSDDMRFAANGVQQMKITTAGVNAPAVDGAMTISGALAAAGMTSTVGLTVTQSTTNTVGATITANGNAFGANITGGSSGPGADIRAGGGNSVGISCTGAGSGTTLDVQPSTTGYGCTIQANGVKAPLVLVASTQPSGANAVGGLYADSSGILYICTTAGTPGTWTKVGTQT